MSGSVFELASGALLMLGVSCAECATVCSHLPRATVRSKTCFGLLWHGVTAKHHDDPVGSLFRALLLWHGVTVKGKLEHYHRSYVNFIMIAS